MRIPDVSCIQMMENVSACGMVRCSNGIWKLHHLKGFRVVCLSHMTRITKIVLCIPGRSVICVRLLQLLHHVSIFYVGINSMILYMFRYYSTHTECLVYKTVHASGTRTPFCFCPVVWNSQGRNLGCAVSSTRTSVYLAQGNWVGERVVKVSYSQSF